MQTDLFGKTSYKVPVTDICRRIMQNKPIAFKSQRILMKEVARELGMSWIDTKLTADERHDLEMLCDLAPDFERRARTIREEAEKAEKGAL